MRKKRNCREAVQCTVSLCVFETKISRICKSDYYPCTRLRSQYIGYVYTIISHMTFTAKALAGAVTP